jgi:RND family efflux transporter MFP subunit
MSMSQPEKRQSEIRRPSRRKWLLVGVGVILAVVVGIGAYGHWQEDGTAAAVQSRQASFVPTVRTMVVKADTDPVILHIPGQTNPFDEAHLYARVNGYVQKWFIDYGTRVHTNDVLAKIDSPDLDQQLAQAKADVLTATANLETASLTAQRSRALNKTQDVSDQAYDVNRGSANAANSQLHAAAANVRRLDALVSYQNIVSPFDGVVTARNIDIGDLVTADVKGGTPLFTIQNDDVLRVIVYVPQSRALQLHVGMDADITLVEMPGKVFHGIVARSAVALDPSSRTLLTEVDVPNKDHVLRSGLYVQVAFSIPADPDTVAIPADAIIFGKAGLQVAVLDGSNHAHLRDVAIAKDLGTTVVLRSGLTVGDTIVVGPPVGLVDGQAVQKAPSEPAKKVAS